MKYDCLHLLASRVYRAIQLKHLQQQTFVLFRRYHEKRDLLVFWEIPPSARRSRCGCNTLIRLISFSTRGLRLSGERNDPLSNKSH